MKKMLTNIKNDKIKALFRNITPMEYILICVPFTITMTSTRDVSQSPFGFVILALAIILGLGVLFLLGLRWRIVYFGILLFLSLFLIVFLGKPFEYWLMADRDSAIRVGIEAILNGENPFKAKTNLGQPPSPLPFTYLFYLPVYLLTNGHPFFMNIIIMAIFCVVSFYKFMDTKRDYLILPIISFIIFSDYFFIEVVMQSDLINVALILCLVLFLLPDEIPEQKKIFKFFKLIPEEPKKINKNSILFAIFFGCLLAMRTNFWLIGIIILLYVFKIYGLKNTFYLGLLTIAVFLVWMLPFMLQDLDYFIYVNPLGHDAYKFYPWRDYDTIEPFGYFILDFLNLFLNYGELNVIIISCFIIICSLLFGLIKCENRFHLLLIIAFCYFAFLFFYFFGPYFRIVRDYVSIAAIPLVFSFLYTDLEKNETKINIKE